MLVGHRCLGRPRPRILRGLPRRLRTVRRLRTIRPRTVLLRAEILGPGVEVVEGPRVRGAAARQRIVGPVRLAPAARVGGPAPLAPGTRHAARVHGDGLECLCVFDALPLPFFDGAVVGKVEADAVPEGSGAGVCFTAGVVAPDAPPAGPPPGAAVVPP